MAESIDTTRSLGLRSVGANGWPLRAKIKRKDKVFNRPVMITTNRAEVKTNGNVAAIDFGTTYCSISYTTEGSDDINTLKLNERWPRVPTAILLYKGKEVTDDGENCEGVTIDSFGYSAQRNYQKIRTTERGDFIYFERIKMNLQHDQNVDRCMKLKADDGSEWFLIEVIALILQYLKDELEKHLSKAEYVSSRTGTHLKATDFDWVITVPSIWQARGKGMMREAGNMAGLCNEQNRICHLSNTYIGIQCPIQTLSPNLTLVPEPEAAAFYCQNMKRENLAKHSKARSKEINLTAEQYVVVDVGGGTVDITAQKFDQETGQIDVIQNPEGNDCGGTMVNREFTKLLQKLLGEAETQITSNIDSAFPKLLSGQDKVILKPCLNHILYCEFEAEKEAFGSQCSCNDDKNDRKEIKVQLPHDIVAKFGLDVLQENVEKLADPRIQLEDDKLYIKFSKVKELFQPALSGILECTRSALSNLMHRLSDFNTIYLVGGFGGSKYVYSHIENLVDTEFPDVNFRVIVPEDHILAIVNGAVRYKKNPIIRSRFMNRTYGIVVSVDYDPSVHSKEHFCYNEDGHEVCGDSFLTFVRKGDPVTINEVAVSNIVPDFDKEKEVHIPFYCSEEPSLEYLNDYRTPDIMIPLAYKVGELCFELPPGDILHKDQRVFTIILDFSSAEIIATVRYQNTGTDVNAILDFLS